MGYASVLPSQPQQTLLQRSYGPLRGVDFSSDASNVGTRRAARSVNMFRAYSARLGECVQTRPGFRRISSCLGGKIWGIHRAAFASGGKLIIHAGTKLYHWTNYPEAATASTLTEIYSGCAEAVSRAFFSAGRWWFLDGTNYLVWSGSGQAADAALTATVPVTTAGRAPAGGGSLYQQVNLLTPKRRNSFSADGAATAYKLDADTLDSAEVSVWLNGAQLTTGFTADISTGTVNFTSPPSTAVPSGTDNLMIEFSHTTQGSADKVKKCTLCALYDDRVFFAGNPDRPNFDVYSMADDPSYFGDLNYCAICPQEHRINGLMVVFDRLFALADNKVYTQAAADSTDELVSRAYPVTGGAECSGCVAPSCCCNFRDDPVFMSRLGLEGVDKLSNYESERYVSHRSAPVDGRLLGESGLAEAVCCEYDGYLLILTGGRVYLADSRLRDGGSYEWFFWDGIGLYSGGTFSPATALAADGSTLLFGTSDGYICRFNTDMTRSDGSGELLSDAYTDDGTRAINSEWGFAFDDFGRPNRYKTLLKKGSVIHARAFSHSKINVSLRTDSETEKQAASINAGYLDFADTDFADFTFNTFDETDPVFRRKVRRFKRLQIILGCCEAGKCFGVYSMVLTARLAGYYRK